MKPYVFYTTPHIKIFYIMSTDYKDVKGYSI